MAPWAFVTTSTQNFSPTEGVLQLRLGLNPASAGTYRVTRTADALAELMADALMEAAACGSPALAQTLAAAVRDAAELAGALPPATRPGDLQVVVY